MLLTLTTEKPAASDLSFLLHKHPGRMQSVEIPGGKAHVFYPVAEENRYQVCLALDINAVALTRKGRDGGPDFALAQYVNDRPYVASSYLSVAIAKAFSTALNGTCKDRPELVGVPIPLQVHLAVLPAPQGGEQLIKGLFEPLGYAVEVNRHPLDPKFPEWGDSRYYAVTLSGTQTVQALLSHLYVLIPVLDTHKHYWVSEAEVEKLLKKGEDWLPNHPERKQISRRYLKGLGRLTNEAVRRLQESDPALAEEPNEMEESPEAQAKRESLHTQRLKRAAEVLVATGAESVVDLGCGEGKLLKLLLAQKQFTRLLGMDVSPRTLDKATERLRLDTLPAAQRERISLIQGSLTYRDARLAGFDAAALIEVIEHLDPDRLEALGRVVFGHARPKVVVLTTPNGEYNVRYETLDAGHMRHDDHRFEWTRAEFQAWVDQIAEIFGYTVETSPLGEEDAQVGAPSQMALFRLKNE